MYSSNQARLRRLGEAQAEQESSCAQNASRVFVRNNLVRNSLEQKVLYLETS